MSRRPGVHLDFETFSELDIQRVGGHRYAEHPSTDIALTGFSIGNETPTVVDHPRDERLHRMFDAVEQGAPVHAHNAQFEQSIWREVAEPYYGWPKVDKVRFKCSAARVAALALPRSLEMAAYALKLPVTKDPRGKKLMDIFSKPQKDGSRIFLRDRPEEAEAFREYNRQDVVTERAITKATPPLMPEEQDLWELDAKINQRGVPVDVELAKRAIEFVEEISDRLKTRCRKITGYNPTQRDKILQWIASRGERIRELTEPVLKEVLKKTKDPVLAEVVRLRLEAGRAGVKKLLAMIDGASDDGRVRGTLLFHAASTGRWSSLRVQLHNLPKGKEKDQNQVLEMLELGDIDLYLAMFDQPLSMLSKSIRGFIKAQYDRLLLCADYSAIEARVLAWMAREKWLIDAFIRGDKDPSIPDVYCRMATLIFGRRVVKTDEFERFMGKQTVLGCGYQMGPDKFRARCKQLGVEISMDFATKAVKDYRQSVPMIRQAWSDVENAAVRAVEQGGVHEAFMCRFFCEDRFLFIELPSGRRLAYLDPTTEDVVTPWGQKKRLLSFMTEWRGQIVPETTYGGKLVENIVQAVSRDLMGHGMINAEKDGFPIILTVHDEVISECDGDIREFSHSICRLPYWAKGLPLKSEGHAMLRYAKR